MKSIDFSKNSWHFKCATIVGYRVVERYDREEDKWVEVHGDICRYSRFVIGGIILCALLFFFATVISAILIEMLLGLAFSLAYGTWIMSAPGGGALLASAIISVALLIGYLITLIKDYARKKIYSVKEPEEPGFIRQAYRSWKDKYCAKITFTEK